ncbi:hypothetical protein Egran_06669 [Elaphomyces granulatus]|uniref:Peptidase S1 domain-containing protein n=1 Tax=Elaphomyces granulatus TaxID=519963 RepID=A0A232LN24_9EURO|nr:hypothetical protein Egran_06669 [Elaphomyces granulatus]
MLRINRFLKPAILNSLNHGEREGYIIQGRQFTFTRDELPRLHPPGNDIDCRMDILGGRLRDRLNSESVDNREVLMGRARFGWPEKSVEVIYVVGVPLDDVAAAFHDAPILVMQGYGNYVSPLSPCSSSSATPTILPSSTPLEPPLPPTSVALSENVPLSPPDMMYMLIEARKALYGENTASREHSARIQLLKRANGLRGALIPPPIFPGQSISGKHLFTMGSFCVHIAPQPSTEDYPDNICYGLTACHGVVPLPFDLSRIKRSVVCPSELDKAALIYRNLPLIRQGSPAVSEALSWTGVIGEVSVATLGKDDNGNRADLAILKLKKEYSSTNTNTTFENQRDPVDKEIIIKEGAGTGTTAGIIGTDGFSLSFQKRDVALPESDSNPATVDVCYMSTVWCEGESFADSGDSGAPILAPGEDGLHFVGMLLGVYHAESPTQDIGLFVSQSVVFEQLEQMTGTKWVIRKTGQDA